MEVELRIERSQNIVCSDSSTLNNILIIVELKLQFMAGDTNLLVATMLDVKISGLNTEKWVYWFMSDVSN